MSFNPALFRGLKSNCPTGPTLRNAVGAGVKQDEPSNSAGFMVAAPTAPPAPHKNETSEKNQSSPLRKQPDKREALDLARTEYFTHKDTCPICSLSWAAVANCEDHGELWLAYHDALVSVHGANFVDGLSELSAEPPASEDGPKGTNGYRTVPTAHIKPESWRVARDAYHQHWFTCQRCKPSGACNEGAALRENYNH